jgi:hypothetical protein
MSHKTVDMSDIEGTLNPEKVTLEVDQDSLPSPKDVKNVFNDPTVIAKLKGQLAVPLTGEIERLVVAGICQYLGRQSLEFNNQISNLLQNWSIRAKSQGTTRSQVYATNPQYQMLGEETQRTLAQAYATIYEQTVEEILVFYQALCLTGGEKK